MLQQTKKILVLTSLIAVFCGASGGHSPEAALQDLKEGNKRFFSNQATHFHMNDQSLAAHLEGQAPDAIVLSCSDSRVPPERIFDQDVGELFTIRVAGNVLNSDVIASIEYAVSSLGSRLIVIMGHDSCGAIKEALNGLSSEEAGSPSLSHLIREIRSNLGVIESKDAPSLDLTPQIAVQKNVSAVAAELTSRSKIIQEAVQGGKVKIAQSVYSLSSGKVDFWD